MSRETRVLLEDIVEGCDQIAAYLVGLDFEAFTNDRKTQDAVVRQFEIIGEAVKRLPPQITEREPEIPWRQIAGFRDVLAHAYFAVELSIVWDAAVVKMRELRAACMRLLG